MPIPILPLLTEGNIRAFTTMRGNCSPEHTYSGFNVCDYTGDDPEHIAKCSEVLSRHFGIPVDRMVIPRQTHSSNVLTVCDLPVTPDGLDNTDAIVTNLHDIIIGVNTADCVPVILADPVAEIAGIAHAGWRGAIGGIVETTVNAMTALGSHPSNIRASMGPSICEECFEVGEEIAIHFDDDCVTRIPGNKPHVSLHKHISKVLCKCGLQDTNISPFDKDLCTKCHPDKFWSARRLGISSGRIFTFMIIG